MVSIPKPIWGGRVGLEPPPVWPRGTLTLVLLPLRAVTTRPHAAEIVEQFTRNVVRAHSFIQLRVAVWRRRANCFLAVRRSPLARFLRAVTDAIDLDQHSRSAAQIAANRGAHEGFPHQEVLRNVA